MRWSHGWGLVGQILAIWISVSFMVSPFIGRYLHARRAQREFKARIAREDAARLLRLARRMRAADWLASFPEHDKQRIQREAEALGFLDPEDTPKLAS